MNTFTTLNILIWSIVLKLMNLFCYFAVNDYYNHDFLMVRKLEHLWEVKKCLVIFIIIGWWSLVSNYPSSNIIIISKYGKMNKNFSNSFPSFKMIIIILNIFIFIMNLFFGFINLFFYRFVTGFNNRKKNLNSSSNSTNRTNERRFRNPVFIFFRIETWFPCFHHWKFNPLFPEFPILENLTRKKSLLLWLI